MIAAFVVLVVGFAWAAVRAQEAEMLVRSRDKRDPRVYVVKDGVKRHIPTLDELRQSYAGMRINNVSEKALSLYNGKIINGQAFKEGTLIRDITKTIYAVGDNILDRVLSLTDLVKKYAGKTIEDIKGVVDPNKGDVTPQSDHGAESNQSAPVEENQVVNP